MKKQCLLLILLLLSVVVSAQDFRFALITDLHVRSNDSLAYNDLRRTVNQLNKTPDISFILVTGDITEEGDRASLLKAKGLLDQLNVKYYIISGNHETKWSESGSTDFAHVFGSERFQFEYNGFKFLGFATGPIIRMMDGHVAPQDIVWLEEELSLNPKQPTILVTHYPLLPTDVDNWYEVTDAVRKYNVKAFLGGHYHSNRLFFYDGIPAFINRSNLRDKMDGLGGYSIYDVTKDSIIVSEQKIGQDLHQWGGYSLTETYYTEDNSIYERPDFSINKEYSKIKEVWVTNIGKTIYASPVVSDNNVFIGDDTGAFYSISAKSGNVNWTFQSGNRIVGTAAVSNDIVVFGSADATIYALNTTNGKLIWKYSAKEPVLGSAIIDNGTVYIGASDHTFRALNLKTGKLIWEYTEVKGYIETRPLIYQGKVIFGAWDNTMYALDKVTGRLIWTWDGGLSRMHFSPAAVWPVAAHGKIFFTAPDRVMTAIDAETGNTVWRTKEPMVRETIGLSEDATRVYSKTMQDSVVCYSTLESEPKRLWITNIGYGYDHAASMPVEKDGIVFGSTKNGVIFALDGLTGKLLWKHKVGNSLIGTIYPLSASECIFVSGHGLVGLLKN
ncbi:PQQ-binding-like beta-propeller repeat protein [Dysgonomonas sp. HGC4]|uniref:outer membrane protein assembly factor BamB family protein n=1 Tax=Dysgonomonas sp. HGC4 TaxID=1658009 RepID=UPI0006814ABB|nr:PQQ-binding-like beta-propeller repeat protein [Dysgonomonas sp. HGC4]MBD8347425.1 PQQ-binding-like beta-propeller repeat protein [Dysgonomonas sp. HGC4]